MYVTNYVSPSYAANAYYNWGPPLTYIAKMTPLKNIESDSHYKNLRLAQLRNVMPPANLRQRHPAWREVLPMAGTARQGHLRSVPNFKMVSGRLNYPDAIPAPASLSPWQDPPHQGKPPISGKPLVIDNRTLTNLQSGPGQAKQIFKPVTSSGFFQNRNHSHRLWTEKGTGIFSEKYTWSAPNRFGAVRRSTTACRTTALGLTSLAASCPVVNLEPTGKTS